MYTSRAAFANAYVGTRRSWWLVLLFGVLALLFGVLAIMNPVATGAGLTWGIGILALLESAAMLLAIVKKDTALPMAWALGYALLSLLFGILAVANPISMAASLVMVAGFWVLLAGCMRLALAIRVRKQVRNEWALAISGVLALVLGLLMLLTPVAGLIMAVVWLGVGAVVYGLLQIFAALRLRKSTL